MFSKPLTIVTASYSVLQRARSSLASGPTPDRFNGTGISNSRLAITIMAVGLFSILAAQNVVRGHGFEGDYFFPPTIQTDDPFATDELSLPMISTFNNPPGGGSPKTRETDISAEFDKEIFPKFAVGISDAYTILNPKGGPSIAGFDNITLSAKYQLLEVPAHQFIFSVGMEWEIGGSGRQSLTNNYSTLSPTIYFGKGFGDLPDSVNFLKPLAITGTVAQDFPVRSLDSNVLEWGIAIEYSIPYYEQHIKDTGLPRPFRDMIPLVEFAMQTLENRGSGGTTGTVNPGVLWEGRYCQIGAEAVIPINRQTGPNIGVVFNVQIWIDDLFPKIFGFPLFGGGQNTPTPGLTK
jgi:hypothetical protein